MVLRSEMRWKLPAIKDGDATMAIPSIMHSESSYFGPPHANPLPKESPHSSTPPSSGSRISPAVLFVIVILAAIFFISGLLHLLVRFLIKKPSSSRANRQTDASGSDALQRQLQQLFHLHDSGLDQAFIDALPVFLYREIGGLKEPFDCAVCLSEFSENDKLRLLPICSHAFHLHCIDTWLLSNSTCPLCRGTLFAPGLAIENPVFEYCDPRVEETLSVEGENGMPTGQKPAEVEETVAAGKKVFSVRLGKFRHLGDDETETSIVEETSSSNLDARRCFSMGSYQYIVGDSNLQVSVPRVRDVSKGAQFYRNSIEPSSCEESQGKIICNGGKRESFSISKIWLWPRKGRTPSSMNNGTCISSGAEEVPDWMEGTQNM